MITEDYISDVEEGIFHYSSFFCSLNLHFFVSFLSVCQSFVLIIPGFSFIFHLTPFQWCQDLYVFHFLVDLYNYCTVCNTLYCTLVLSAAASPFDSFMLCCCKASSIFICQKCGEYAFLLVAMPTVCIWRCGVCSRFLFTRWSRRHTHSILCLRRLVSDASIVVSHI